VTRYLAVHGTGRVSAAVLVAPLLPSLLKTDDNAEGIRCAMRRTAISPAQRAEMRGDYLWI